MHLSLHLAQIHHLALYPNSSTSVLIIYLCLSDNADIHIFLSEHANCSGLDWLHPGAIHPAFEDFQGDS